MITQNGESSHGLLLSVTNRKALAPGRHSLQSSPPFKTLITLLPVTISQHDPQLGVLVVDRLSFNRWLKLFICQNLAGWHLELKTAVLKLVLFPVYIGCYALHYGIMYVSILYTLYIQIVC